MTISLHTLGCKLNYAETSSIAEQFRREGFVVVDFGDPSDVTVVNSCSVTENADRECRKVVRRALRANPDSFVIVTGCYAQLQPEEIASIDGVDLVLGSAEKFRIFQIESQFEKRATPSVIVGDIAEETGFGPAFSSEGDARTRAFLKVQDGCDYTCSFCTIPLARGASRSQSVEEACRQAGELVEAGYREIVITGVNVGDFGRKGDRSFYDLLVALHEVRGLERLKISSIEPNLLDDSIIDLAAGSDRLLPHFHIPLQSGSDEILARMRRRYRSDLYRARVERIVSAIPDAAIGVDVIVGFPGESDRHFQETYDFLNDLPVAYLHVFTYSERQNTPAAGMGAIVPVEERRRRTKMLRILSEKKRAAFAGTQRNKVRSVLMEGTEGELAFGYTDNHIRIGLPAHLMLRNRILDVRIGEFQGEYSLCEIAGERVDTDLRSRLALPVLNVISCS